MPLTIDTLLDKVASLATRTDALVARVDSTDRREVEQLADKLRAKGKTVTLHKDKDGYIDSVTVDGRSFSSTLSFAEWARPQARNDAAFRPWKVTVERDGTTKTIRVHADNEADAKRFAHESMGDEAAGKWKTVSVVKSDSDDARADAYEQWTVILQPRGGGDRQTFSVTASDKPQAFREADRAARTKFPQHDVWEKISANAGRTDAATGSMEQMVQSIMQLGDLDHAQAMKAFRKLQEVKAIKAEFDGSRYLITHGGFMDKPVLRRAAGIADAGARADAADLSTDDITRLMRAKGQTEAAASVKRSRFWKTNPRGEDIYYVWLENAAGVEEVTTMRIGQDGQIRL